jgi:nucleoside-diphosphate-sugar epimerase
LYNLGGGIKNSGTLREIVDLIARIIQCNAVIDEEAKVPAPIPLNYISDITRVREELGWQPEFNMETGLHNVL